MRWDGIVTDRKRETDPDRGRLAPARRRVASPAAVAGLALLGALVILAGAAPSRAGDPPSAGPLPSLGAAGLGRGRFLVAARSLSGGGFAESVVLLLEHGPGGSLGLILNRPSSVELRLAFPAIDALASRTDRIHFGGPVGAGSAIFLVRSSTPPARGTRIFADVYATGSADDLAAAAARPAGEGDLRVFAGWAGWAPAQLEAEVRRGDWSVIDADAASVFTRAPATLWSRLIERLSASWCRAEGALSPS